MVRTKRISLEQLRKVLGLESIRDATGNIVREAAFAEETHSIRLLTPSWDPSARRRKFVVGGKNLGRRHDPLVSRHDGGTKLRFA